MEDKKQKAYDWILRIIESCTDTFHFDAALELIRLFEEQFNEKGGTMSYELRKAKSEKFLKVHNILH